MKADSQLFITICGKAPNRGRLTIKGVSIKGAPKYIGVFLGYTYVGYISRTTLKFTYEKAAKLSNDEKSRVWAQLMSLEQFWAQAICNEGESTGVCACCQRTLTDPVSIMRGIGPDCMKRWKVRVPTP